MSKTRQKKELLSPKWAKIPNAPCLKSLCVTPLWSWFWGTSQSPNWAHDSSLESSTCLISNPSGIFQFGVHFPLQKFNLPKLVLVCEKSGRKAIFKVFLTLYTTQNLMKSLSHSRACIIHHKKSKNVNFSSRRCPNHKRALGGATHRAEKTVLQPKFSKWKNLLQICWNLEWRSPIMSHA